MLLVKKPVSSKWKSQVFIDLNASNKSSYAYYDADNKARNTSINGKGSLELVYSMDYKIFPLPVLQV